MISSGVITAGRFAFDIFEPTRGVGRGGSDEGPFTAVIYRAPKVRRMINSDSSTEPVNHDVAPATRATCLLPIRNSSSTFIISGFSHGATHPSGSPGLPQQFQRRRLCLN